ncbi:MAG: hypothetical protein JOZ83_06485 [Silvibacterium sp.]|nr:hypothetical protein [Silvibacterium sp.]
MKHPRFWITLGVFALLTAGSITSLRAENADSQGFHGASYVTTVKDSQGNFASRGVITLHADHTMSVIDSGQGGPTFFFSSQLGSWKFSNDGLVARTIDFDYPPNADVVRLDYTFTLSQDRKAISGTIKLTTFPLEADPQGGGGTVVGTFTFAGELITP